MFTGIGLSQLAGGNLFNYGLNAKNMCVVVIAIAVLWMVSVIEEHSESTMPELLGKQNLVFRWIIIYALFFAVLVFGKYGPGYDAANFIYEQF